MDILFHQCLNGFKGEDRGLLGIRQDGLVVNEGLEGLAVFSLKHHFNMMPLLFALVFHIWINVQGFNKVYGPDIERLPLLCLIRGIEREFGGFLAGVIDLEAIFYLLR